MSNTNEKSFIANLISNPTSFSILVLSAVIVVVWLDQRDSESRGSSTESVTAMMAPTPQVDAPLPGAGLLPPISMKGPSVNNSDMPSILSSMGAQTAPSAAPDKLQAPGLDGLLAGLEAKVKANPDDIGKRLLLAQTYNELGLADKALVELRDMRKINPEHPRVNLVLSSILSSSDKDEDVKESLSILDMLTSDDSVQQYLVQMYRGNAMIRQQNHEGAMAQWAEALKGMPEADNRREMLEKRLDDLTSKGNPSPAS